MRSHAWQIRRAHGNQKKTSVEPPRSKKKLRSLNRQPLLLPQGNPHPQPGPTIIRCPRRKPSRSRLIQKVESDFLRTAPLTGQTAKPLPAKSPPAPRLPSSKSNESERSVVPRRPQQRALLQGRCVARRECVGSQEVRRRAVGVRMRDPC